MLKGTTKRGFNFKIDENNLDDWELLEVLSEIDNGKETLAPKAIKMLLGEKQYQDLKDFLRQNGKVSIQSSISRFKRFLKTKW